MASFLPFKIVIIGAGGVATSIGRLLSANGIRVIQILGRSAASTRQLADKLQCRYILDPQQLDQSADLYIIAVQDREIAPLLTRIKVPENAVVVHTAGGVSLDIFKGHFSKYGVLYPLQSLRKETIEVPEIPFYLDANAARTKDFLEDFSKQARLDYRWADDGQRMQLHVAAVFCSNFPNYLYSLAEKFCNDNQLAFASLLPIIEETASRLKREATSPAWLQTGPAIRGDVATTDKHLQLLEKDKEAFSVYQLLSGKIMHSRLLGK